MASKICVEQMNRPVNDALTKGAKRSTVEPVADEKVQDGANAYIPVILNDVISRYADGNAATPPDVVCRERPARRLS